MAVTELGVYASVDLSSSVCIISLVKVLAHNDNRTEPLLMRFQAPGRGPRCASTGSAVVRAFAFPGRTPRDSRGRMWGRLEENRDTVRGRQATRCKSVRIRGAGRTSKPRAQEGNNGLSMRRATTVGDADSLSTPRCGVGGLRVMYHAEFHCQTTTLSQSLYGQRVNTKSKQV